MGLAGLVAGLFLRRRAKADTPELLPNETADWERQETRRGAPFSTTSLVGTLEGEATVNTYGKAGGGWGHRFFTNLRIDRPHSATVLRDKTYNEAYDIVPLVAWGDRAKAFYGLVESGKLPPGTKVQVLGAVSVERNGTTEWVAVTIDQMRTVA
jgi:hypothetical protein